MIKILFILPDLRGGGAQKVTTLLLNNISKNKFSVHLALIENTGEFRDNLNADIQIYDLKCKRRRYAIVPLIRLLNRLKPDIVFSTLFLLNVIVIMSRFLGLVKSPVVIREATTLSKSVQNNYLYKFLLQLTYPRATRIVCLTEAMSKDMKSFLSFSSNNIVIIGNPVEDNVYQKNLSLKSKRMFGNNINFLTIGRLSYAKGIDILLGGFEKLLKVYPNANLHIMGVGEEENNLKSFANRLKISSNVHFWGFIKNAVSYFDSVDALVLPSRFEGLPNAVLEALAHGLPVLCSSIPATQQLIRPFRSGILFEPNNPDSLADALLNFIKNGVKWDKEKIRQSINDFRVEKIIKQYEQLFLEVIENYKIMRV